MAALAFLPFDVRDALATAVGGGAVVVAAALSLAIALGGGIRPAGMAMAKLLLGMAAKWATVAIVLFLGLAVWRLPRCRCWSGCWWRQWRPSRPNF